MNDSPELWTTAQVARYISKPARTVRHHRKALKGKLMFGRLMYPAAHVAEWFERNRPHGTAPVGNGERDRALAILERVNAMQ